MSGSDSLKLPKISEDQRTPVVDELLGVIEKLFKKVSALEAEVRTLKRLSNRPKFTKKKSSSRHQGSSKKTTGRNKRADTNPSVKIDKEQRISVDSIGLPEGSRFKGYRRYLVQDIEISTQNTLFKLERWRLPDGSYKTAQLPKGYRGYHYGPTLRAYILYQYYHQRVTQQKLLDQIRGWGIRLSSGELSHLLTKRKSDYHKEKEALLTVGLEVSSRIHTDDTGAKHQGKNYYCTHIGNEKFAYFETVPTKSRLDFLKILHGKPLHYCLDELVMRVFCRDRYGDKKTPSYGIQCLTKTISGRYQGAHSFKREAELKTFLGRFGVKGKSTQRQFIELSLLRGFCLKRGSHELTIVSDEAQRFLIGHYGLSDYLHNALCWLHAERKIRELTPLKVYQREEQVRAQAMFWRLYDALVAYRHSPNDRQKPILQRQLRNLLNFNPRYCQLKEALKRLANIKELLLWVLERPEVALHNNLSENDIREHVIHRKISGSTRSEDGLHCRDTFISLSKTCMKQGISFWDYLMDRQHAREQVPQLAIQIATNAQPP